MTEQKKIKSVKEKKDGGLNVSAKSFITAILVILVLMILTYTLTLFVPGGAFTRDESGEIIRGSFHSVSGGIPFWKWLLSPFLILASDGSAMIIAIIVFLLIIGGVFNALGEHGLMKYMLEKITYRFGKKRYTLLAVVSFFFMAMGALIGSFEECVPLVPIVVALATALGWDKLTGMGMSLLAIGCGFASGVCNPFTVGVAQQLAGLPMFSGIWLRAVSFVFIYALLFAFLYFNAKRVEKPISEDRLTIFDSDKRMDRGLVCFGVILGFGILLVLSSSFITILRDYTLVIVAVMFLAAGITSAFASGMKTGVFLKSFGNGVVSMLPAVIMILMASSIKYTLDNANVLDTVLNRAIIFAEQMPRWSAILFIYLIVLVMNFFIGSGSAKAFMLIPLIVPLAKELGISAQLTILAFAFGDGFSNTLYPTNAALLVSLGLADIGYTEWFKRSILFQLTNLILTSGLLLFGLAVGY